MWHFSTNKSLPISFEPISLIIVNKHFFFFCQGSGFCAVVGSRSDHTHPSFHISLHLFIFAAQCGDFIIFGFSLLIQRRNVAPQSDWWLAQVTNQSPSADLQKLVQPNTSYTKQPKKNTTLFYTEIDLSALLFWRVSLLNQCLSDVVRSNQTVQYLDHLDHRIASCIAVCYLNICFIGFIWTPRQQ